MECHNKYKYVVSTIRTVVLLVVGLQALAVAQTVNWQGPAGLTIKSVHYLKTESLPRETSAQLSSPALLEMATTLPYPVPPLAGFSPLIAITTSNKHVNNDDTYEHELEYSYDGSPLNSPIEDNFIIGVFDSGAEVDLVAGDSADTLGLTSSWLTDSTYPVGGVGGSISTVISEPLGIFAASLGAIGSNGQLDPNHLVGHSNVSILVAPEISCESTEESITGVMGTPFLSFYTTVIRNNYIHTINIGGQDISGPDVEILDKDDPSIPEYSHKISMSLSSPAVTANYYPEDIFGLTSPTLLSAIPGYLPTGGKFIATLYVLEGEPGPLNVVQPMRVMVDTGAQSSIITPSMAANLSLPLNGDFEVDVCGIGGLEPNVPGYYVDYVKINALGGALEFSNAPFVVLDLVIPDASGAPLDGILGMNFFWNRNIVFAPDLFSGGFLHVSDPIFYGNADFNFDGDVNLIDLSMLTSAWLSRSPEPEYLPVCDLYLDSKIDMKDFQVFASHWLE